MNYFDLHGKCALITGSNRGIGKAIALGLASYGCDVIIHCRREDERSKAVIENAKQYGVYANAVYADLNLSDAPKSIFQQIQRLDRMPDILVLNASIQYRCRWDYIDDVQFDEQINVNFRASLKLIQLFTPYMQEKKWGRIIAIGSIQQQKPHPEMLVYATSKMAQLNMVQNLASQLAPYGITANVISYGTIYTDRNKEALSNTAYLKKIQDDIPLGFIGKPEDCVAPVLMLCGEGGRYITGIDLVVDGGKHL